MGLKHEATKGAVIEVDDDRAQQVVPSTCRCVDWYSEGESRCVEVDGVRITVRFIGRKGRRGRISIEAPAGTVFEGKRDGQIGSR